MRKALVLLTLLIIGLILFSITAPLKATGTVKKYVVGGIIEKPTTTSINVSDVLIPILVLTGIAIAIGVLVLRK